MYHNLLPWILTLSILLQLASAVIAVLLIKSSGYYKPWIFIAASITLMAVRRINSFANMVESNFFPEASLVPESIALLISILMLFGLILFRPVFIDIKKRYKDSERKIRQKDISIKESNHRIKNDLLIVSSLINLKASTLGGDADLSDLSHQIDAIRIVHDKLRYTEDVDYVYLVDYLTELVESIFSPFPDVFLDIEIGNFVVPSRTAVPLGLLLNEIATNAIKHGFTTKEKQTFTLSIQKDGEEDVYLLTASNTGAPFPEEIDLTAPNSLGLQLIKNLVSQIDGTIELRKSPYPEFSIRFPVEE